MLLIIRKAAKIAEASLIGPRSKDMFTDDDPGRIRDAELNKPTPATSSSDCSRNSAQFGHFSTEANVTKQAKTADLMQADCFARKQAI